VRVIRDVNAGAIANPMRSWCDGVEVHGGEFPPEAIVSTIERAMPAARSLAEGRYAQQISPRALPSSKEVPITSSGQTLAWGEGRCRAEPGGIGCQDLMRYTVSLADHIRRSRGRALQVVRYRPGYPPVSHRVTPLPIHRGSGAHSSPAPERREGRRECEE
jgi:hypothetical protein